jgi:hypothetical protein
MQGTAAALDANPCPQSVPAGPPQSDRERQSADASLEEADVSSKASWGNIGTIPASPAEGKENVNVQTPEALNTKGRTPVTSGGKRSSGVENSG